MADKTDFPPGSKAPPFPSAPPSPGKAKPKDDVPETDWDAVALGFLTDDHLRAAYSEALLKRVAALDPGRIAEELDARGLTYFAG